MPDSGFVRSSVAGPSNVPSPTPAPSQVPSPPPTSPAATPAPAAAPAPTGTQAPVLGPDGKPVAAAAPETREARLAQSFAVLARAEQKRVQKAAEQTRAFAAREAAIKAAEDKLSATTKSLEDRLAQFEQGRKDPLKWMELGGHSYDALTAQYLDQGKAVPPEVLVRSAVDEANKRFDTRSAEIEAKVEAERKAREEADTAAKAQREANEKAQVAAFNQKALDFVKDHPQDYVATIAYGVEQYVPQVIRRKFEESLAADMAKAQSENRQPVGTVLSYKDAADMTEKWIRGLHEKSAEALKSQGKPAVPAVPTADVAPAPTPTVAAPSPTVVPETPSPTLTNGMVTSPSPAGSGKLLPEGERWKRAIAALSAPNAVRR